MRSALCLLGKVGTIKKKSDDSLPVDFELCSQYYKKHIIEPNNCDVFIHSWSVEFKEKLLTLYRPKKSLIEPQIDFSERLGRNRNRDFRHLRNYSRNYSLREVVRLKKEYEEDNSFKYDWVMLGRFDLVFLKPVHFSGLEPGYLYVEPSRKKAKLLPVTGKRIQDYFFLSDSELIDRFAFNIEKCGISKVHTALWKYIHKVIGPPKSTVKFLGRIGYDYNLYRYINPSYQEPTLKNIQELMNRAEDTK